MKIENLNKKPPLAEYPWVEDVDRLTEWASAQKTNVYAFCFDLLMSLSYVDATSGIEKYIEYCPNCPEKYNSHLGFINLCSPCYEEKDICVYQKAAKPRSGALGKLSSEIILRFIKGIFPSFKEVYAIGGTETIDALIEHKNGITILAEVKSAPLLTYPVLFKLPNSRNKHEKINLTSSQLGECSSAIYMHNKLLIPLGQVKSELWPFRPAIDFITDIKNKDLIFSFIKTWENAKDAYKTKNRVNKFYYLTNACGQPPSCNTGDNKWKKGESISDSKTSAGLDRTDDIKKGIYQVLKIGTQYTNNLNIKTAIISNLPAYRHGSEYITPFMDMLWGKEKDIIDLGDSKVLRREDLKYVFDYIISLENEMLRDLSK